MNFACVFMPQPCRSYILGGPRYWIQVNSGSSKTLVLLIPTILADRLSDWSAQSGLLEFEIALPGHNLRYLS